MDKFEIVLTIAVWAILIILVLVKKVDDFRQREFWKRWSRKDGE